MISSFSLLPTVLSKGQCNNILTLSYEYTLSPSDRSAHHLDYTREEERNAHCCKTFLSNNLSSLLLSAPAAISETGPSGILICRREPLRGRPVAGSRATRVKRESETGRIVGFEELRSSIQSDFSRRNFSLRP